MTRKTLILFKEYTLLSIILLFVKGANSLANMNHKENIKKGHDGKLLPNLRKHQNNSDI